jgi:hypothetical protein
LPESAVSSCFAASVVNSTYNASQAISFTCSALP